MTQVPSRVLSSWLSGNSICRKASLLWEEFHKPLPDNYDLSSLKGLLWRLQDDSKILDEYSTIIQDQLNAGIIVTVDQPDSTPGKTHYIPCLAVVRQDKDTTKVELGDILVPLVICDI